MPAGYGDIFCADCSAGFSPMPAAHCCQCALPFAGVTNSSHLCGRCIKESPAYTNVFTVGLYEQTLRQAIHQFKFNQKVGLDRPLGQLMAQSIASDLDIDLIIPVPLHRKRLQERSYNQALLLAREISRIKKIPLEIDLLQKQKETASQQGLSAREREQNLQNAFVVAGGVKAKTVLLVDDVMTTGATVAACSKELKGAGAAAIHVVVIGRAAI